MVHILLHCTPFTASIFLTVTITFRGTHPALFRHQLNLQIPFVRNNSLFVHLNLNLNSGALLNVDT